MDLSKVKEWVIPEGIVTKIVSAGKTLWESVKWIIVYGDSPAYDQIVPQEVRSDCKLNKIGGHSEVISGEIVSSQVDKLIIRGRNLWDEITESGYINGSGDYAPSPLQYPSLRSANFTECIPNTLYSFIKPSTWSVNLNVAWYDENKSFISRVGKSGVIQEQTSPNNARYFKLSLYNYGVTYKNDVAAVKGSTTTGYTPYRQPQEIVTGFPELRSEGSVYDYVDVTEGKLHKRVGVIEEIITDIEIPEPLTKRLSVESGGIITFHNSYHFPVPNEVEYYVELENKDAE